MKTLLLAVSLLFATLTLRAQSAANPVSATPYKRANAVLVITSDSASVALKKLGAILVAKGYNIKKLDTDFNTITTEPKAVMGTQWYTVIAIRGAATPTGISLSAEVTTEIRAISPGSEHTVTRVFSNGKKPTGYFRWLMEIAASYPGATVHYTQD
ncbi:hypothetical protein [Hymenobacter cellulosivorans]|uniref:Uncharacterized protein n=1 Tax=Hymenobacter cellulosivorans TaxID=2932249 RepID=A0ABY4F685_9BACT|nr:hypothetical protein [Hymenobacter cellulosivorans]UOQ51721.1 hypothetical protein MUN80_18390 [Hymenobacter cellulosivorans]